MSLQLITSPSANQFRRALPPLFWMIACIHTRDLKGLLYLFSGFRKLNAAIAKPTRPDSLL